MRERMAIGNIYHTLTRGVDKRKIFLDKEDHFRFIHDLFEFNDIESVNNLTHYFRKQYKDVGRPYIDLEEKKPRKLLVKILAFCLMPNHYHLLLSPLVNDGISKFMRKVNIGYAKYFNEKYQRTGTLFEGRYKSVSISKDSHFLWIPYYIHSNPLDLKFPKWRNKEIKDYKGAMEFLENYRWSSFPDYIGKKNFPSVTQREFLSEFFGGPKQYKKDFLKWLKEMDLQEIKDRTLES